MRLHRPQLDAEPVGDLLVEQALGDQAEHLVLVRRQATHALGQQRIARRGLRARHHVAQRRWQPRLAVQHLPQRIAQVGHARALGQVAGGTEVERAADHRGLVVGGDDDDGQPGPQCADRRKTGQAVVTGHVQIEQQQVDVVPFDRF